MKAYALKQQAIAIADLLAEKHGVDTALLLNGEVQAQLIRRKNSMPRPAPKMSVSAT